MMQDRGDQVDSSNAAKPQDPDESLVAARNFDEFLRTYNLGHRNYVTFAHRAFDYYNGDHWTDQDTASLGDRPNLTINIAKKAINAIMGHYARTRADITLKPTRSGSEQAAWALTSVFDNIFEKSQYRMVETQAVLDGMITDRGYLDCRLDFRDNIFGDLRIKARDPRDVILDPEAKEYDSESWSQVSVIEWQSIDAITQVYGKDKADQVRTFVDLGQYYGSESIRFGGFVRGTYPGDTKESDRIAAVRVVDRQHRVLTMYREFVDLETGDRSPVPDNWEPARVQLVCHAANMAVRKVLGTRIRWTVTVDHVLLHDDWSPYEHFTIIPYFPYFTRGRPTGVMRDLISPQDQLNKIESQILHVVNTTANSGWVVEAGSLANMNIEDLEERGAETGLVLAYLKGRTPPVKIQPNQVPTGLEEIARKSYSYITDIPGVAGLMGEKLREMSGVAFNAATTAAQNGLQVPFENLRNTRWMLARFMLSAVQRYYTEPRLMRVTDWRSPEEQQMDLQINTQLLNNITIGKYDVVVGNVPARDTLDEQQFQQLVQMREAGIAIPAYHIIEASHLKNKDVIAAEVKQIEGLGDKTPEQQQQEAMVQQLQMRGMMAKVAEAEAKAASLQAGAQLSGAKARGALADPQIQAAQVQGDLQMSLASLKADLEKFSANLQNKLELAAIHASSKERLTRYTTQVKSMDHHAQLANERFKTVKTVENRPRAPAQ